MQQYLNEILIQRTRRQSAPGRHINKKLITSGIVFELYDENMRRCGSIKVFSWFDLVKNETCIKVLSFST